MPAQRCTEFVASVPGIGSPDQSMWTDAELRSYAGAEAAYFREHQVAVAVTGWTLSTLLSTRLAGIPLVTDHAGAWLPPLFERGRLPLPSMPIGLPAERLLPAWLRTRLYNRGAPRAAIYTAGFNRVAAELGVPGVPSFAALLLGDLTLVTDVPEILGIPRAELDNWTPRDPARYRPGTRLRYAGPIYAELDLPVPAEVERFLAGRGPVVYVAITSSPADLVRSVVRQLTGTGARILVAGTVHDLADLQAENVLVGGVLPSHKIMPRVDLAVISGGQGSVQTALAAGLPFAGIPLQPEQDANVALAERQGAARRVPQQAAGGPRLSKVVLEMLADSRYRAQAGRLQQVFARVDGPAVAAELIQQLARERPGAARPA
jgi:UDP:flavonoid glycosyltransferase YjiC (YdhE family)